MMESGTRAYLLAPIVRDRKGEYKKEFKELKKQGFQRVKVNGAFYDLDDVPELDKKFRHNIDVVVDRIVIKEGIEKNLNLQIYQLVQSDQSLNQLQIRGLQY